MARSKIIIALAVVSLLFFVLGFFASRLLPKNIVNTNLPAASQIQASKVLTNQKATTTGEIIALEGNNLTFKSEQGETTNFPIFENVVIYKINIKQKSNPAQFGIDKIVTNQKAQLTLELIQDKYTVVSVLYY